MADQAPPTELDQALACTIGFQERTSEILGNTIEVASHHDLLTQGTCRPASEHGMSVVLPIAAGHAKSAIGWSIT